MVFKYSLARRLLKRVLSAEPRELLHALKPTRISQLLFEIDPTNLVTSQLTDLSLVYERCHTDRPSKLDSINERITSVRDVYCAFSDEKLAHHSTLFFDVLLPEQFGFCKDAPVIGACWTDPDFRGRRIYPQMLRHIAQDVFERQAAKKVYILVSSDNRASIRGVEHAGFRWVAHLIGIRLAGLSLRKRIERQRPTNNEDAH